MYFDYCLLTLSYPSVLELGAVVVFCDGESEVELGRALHRERLCIMCVFCDGASGLLGVEVERLLK